MNRLSKQIVAGLIGLGGLCGSFSEASACGGRGGIGGYGGGYRPARISYVQPTYPQHRPQPWVGTPSQIPPQFAQQKPLNPGVASTPQFPAAAQASAPRPTGPSAVGGVAGTAAPARQVTARRVSSAPQASQQLPASQSALESLGGMGLQQAPAAGQQAIPQQQSQQPVQPQQRPVARSQQPATQPAQHPAPESSPMSQAQQSALAALGGMEETLPLETAAPVEQAPLSSHVGQWKATLGNGATVELTLQADGSFVWVANSQGKTSSFEGSYSLENGSLTLVRSSDNQKLAGQFTPTSDGGMNFRLNGAKDAGLTFLRS